MAAIAADFDISRFWADFDLSKPQPAKKPKKRRKQRKRKLSPEMVEKVKLATAIMEEHLAKMERNRAARVRRRGKVS